MHRSIPHPPPPGRRPSWPVVATVTLTLVIAIASGCSRSRSEGETHSLDATEPAEQAQATTASPANTANSPPPVATPPQTAPKAARATATDSLAQRQLAPADPSADQNMDLTADLNVDLNASSADRSATRSMARSAAPPPSVSPSAASSATAVAPAAADTLETNPLDTLPAGSSLDADGGFATVAVFYATDRLADPLPLSAYTLSGPRRLIGVIGGLTLVSLLVGCYSWLQGNVRWAGMALVGAVGSAAVGMACVALSGSQIEKRGVTYSGDRGELVHGISEVTVPLVHQRGQVERPSLLRFELVEDQQKHIVLTSATELNPDDFHQRLAASVAESPAADVLVFIHGYNVDFQSAVRRTAQIAVDLPFEGVPVCYSWPSQGSLLGYAVDETNAQWTEPHLHEFLQGLLERSGAQSIHVVAHSMGNRPMTAVMQRFAWQQSTSPQPLFDRIVLAAPDVDADRFRRELAPVLASVSQQTTLYASSSDQALIVSKLLHGYPRAGDSGPDVVVVPGIETIDVSGIDLSLLGHSYYGDNESMLRDLYDVVRQRLPAPQRALLTQRQWGDLIYWQLAQQANDPLPTGGNAAATALPLR